MEPTLTHISDTLVAKRISDRGEQAAALTAAEEGGPTPRALEQAYRWDDHGGHPHHGMVDMKLLPAREIDWNVTSTPAW
ncbi:MAG: hypothetical protein ACE5MM_03570 [Nitrospiraceae bacterium]